MEAPNRLQPVSLTYYSKLSATRREIDDIYVGTLVPKKEPPKDFLGRAVSVCQNMTAVGIQKAVIGKIRLDLFSREKELQEHFSKKEISENHFSLFTMELARLMLKLGGAWKAIDGQNESSQPMTDFNSYDYRKLSLDQVEDSERRPEQMASEYFHFIKQKFVVKTSSGRAYDTAYLPHLAQLYTQVQYHKQLNDSQKTTIRNLILEVVGEHLSLERKNKEGQSIAGVAKTFAAKIDLESRWKKTSEVEKKVAKKDFEAFLTSKYYEKDEYMLAFRKLLLEESSTIL